MLTEAQETAYIHGLLPRLLAPDNSILLVEDLAAAGHPYKEVSAVIERLETENLAKRGYSTTVALTTLGRQVARSSGGYTAHLRQQRRQARTKTVNEWLGAYGSLAGGIAGIAGIVLSVISLVGSRGTADEMDNVHIQLRELTHAQAVITTRVALLEQRASAVQTSTTLTRYTAAKPSRVATKTMPAPAPASAPIR